MTPHDRDLRAPRASPVPCYACGRPMPPGVSWHDGHDARCPAEVEIDRQLGIDTAERDRMAAEEAQGGR